MKTDVTEGIWIFTQHLGILTQSYAYNIRIYKSTLIEKNKLIT